MTASDLQVPPCRPQKRVFWLGMHQVLTQTELPRLRRLGYEVFHPPYLSDVQDQSAVRDWQPSNDLTLPADVIAKLGATNFFYKQIPKDVAEILNHYFDALIVTINPGWLHAMLRAYRGPVIYRVFGQPYSLSSELMNIDAAPLIAERERFWFAPHSAKVLSIEDPWLMSNMKIIPYCLTQDVVDLQDTWRLDGSESERVTGGGEIGMLCPRALDIPYYKDNYNHLKAHFPKANYRIFGAQIVPVDDPQVVGTLTRAEFLHRMQLLRGYIYHYYEPTVCYLPPLEFMMLGGPVAFQKGSLLASYFEHGEKAPGFARDIGALQLLVERIERGDRALIDDIIASQSPVRQLYHPDHVWPIFDREMKSMLDGAEPAPASNFMLTNLSNSAKPQGISQPHRDILLPFHAFGPHIHKRDSDYHCAEGIARVMRQAVRALTAAGYKVIVTAHKNDIGRIHGFFLSIAARPELLQVLTTSSDVDGGVGSYFRTAIRKLFPRRRLRAAYQSVRDRFSSFLAMPVSKAISPRYQLLALVLLPVLVIYGVGRSLARGLVRPLVRRLTKARGNQLAYVANVARRKSLHAVLVPHYHLFPEAADIAGKPIVLYLPDYLPHFYRDQADMGATEEILKIGKRICQRATAIFTNSRFTQNYLSKTALEVESGKIVYFPLPDLGNEERNFASNVDLTDLDLPHMYVFYPTRERTSKRLGDFADTVAEVNRRLERRGVAKRLYGVLTIPPSEKVFARSPDARPFIKSLLELSDSQLRGVYRRALALLFTSELEGNFPTQINEALNLRVPIIATRIPLITDELGDWFRHLTLVDVGDVDGFATAVLDAMEDSEGVLRLQDPLRDHIRNSFSYDVFAAGLVEIFEKLSPVGHRAREMHVEGADRRQPTG